MTAQSFFTEFNRLLSLYPKQPIHIVTSDNCELSDVISNSKNLIYCFDTHKSTDSFYMYDSFICDNCGDCDYAVESQLCYESVDPFKCFNCDFIEYSANMRDSMYCYWSMDCQDVFGCVNLKGKKFCIFNRQLTEVEYRQKVEEYKKWPSEKVLAEVEKLKLRFPLTQTVAAYNDNSDFGNYIHHSKNCYMCFDAAHNENCGYLYDSFGSKNCFDMFYGGNGNELCYENIQSPRAFNCDYLLHALDCQDSSYLVDCFNVKNSLGCIGLRQKEYCILNRQFNKEDYEKLSGQILGELKMSNLGWANLQY